MCEKQTEILEIIKTFIKENGYSPTVREICRLANIKSTSTVHKHLKKLKDEGNITKGADMPRSIVVTEEEPKYELIVNSIALFYEDHKEYILLQENKKSNDFMFELPGGIIREGENVYGCLRRQLNDKGFEVTHIFGEEKCNRLKSEEETLTVFKPFCISQSFSDNNPVIANTILCEVDHGQVKDVKSKSRFKVVCTEDLKDILESEKEQISPQSVAALKSFCEMEKCYI